MRSTVRVVNLEQGMPLVDTALRRMTSELYTARRQGIAVVKLIHGYGSSGTGGKIRVAVRRQLSAMKARREIIDCIAGENFSIFDEATRNAFWQCEELRKDRDLDRHNNGVTFVVLTRKGSL